VATASSPDRLQLIGLHCVKNSGIEKGRREKTNRRPSGRGEPPGLRLPPLSISRL
jgi:hypothetical protein